MDKILVVDDEVMICEGMRRTLAGMNCFEVLVAHSGVDALAILRSENIQAMLLDIEMPEMNGIELMRILQEENRQPLTIIISGYDKFEYAKEALNYGAADYLLKPVDSLDIREIGGKIFEQLAANHQQEQDLQQLRGFVKNNLNLIRQKLLYDILGSKAVPIDPDMIRETYGVDLRKSAFITVVLLARRTDEAMDEVEFQVALKLIENILEEQLAPLKDFYLFHIENARFVLLAGSDTAIDRAGVDALTGRVMNRISKVAGVDVFIGVGNEVHSVTEIVNSYNNANSALDYKSLFGAGFVYDIGDYRKDKDGLSFQQLYLELRVHLNAMRYGEARESLERVFAFLPECRELPASHRNYYALRCIMLLMGVLIDNGVDTIDAFFGELTAIRYGLRETALPTLQTFAFKLMETVSNEVTEKYAQRTQQVARLVHAAIQREYQDNRLSVNQLSEQLSYSANYLGAVFKQAYGVTINEFINQFRVEQAKVLMDESDLRIYEIAFAVGFNDQHYFSRTFRKYAACSPSEYRERRVKHP